MNTKELQYFMKVCEEQSINKAAGKLFITQQGLSRVIANLEKNLNVKLLERNARGVFPTEEGQYLYEKCEKLICMLDEIEAALDDANVSRFAQYLRRVSDKTQFIVITHRRGTMEAANVLYGVTMQEDGVSKLLKLDLEQVDATLVS